MGQRSMQHYDRRIPGGMACLSNCDLPADTDKQVRNEVKTEKDKSFGKDMDKAVRIRNVD